MCFSASASFGAGAVLTVIGFGSVLKAKKPSQWIFAGVPFLFGIQQIIEGFTWVALLHPEHSDWQKTLAHAFLFFAHVLWPVWIPLSILLLEEKSGRKKILFVILLIAVLLSVSEVYYLFAYSNGVSLVGRHISYTIYFPETYEISSEIIYVIVTLLPCFISSSKRIWVFGYCLILTLIFSAIFYKFYLISVWCFFAAITSMIIYFIILKLNLDKTTSSVLNHSR